MKVVKLTTDAGWGCVIRCTQMLMANCLRTLTKPQVKTPEQQQILNSDIITLFDDDKRNTVRSSFSIQNIVEVGLNDHGQQPGEWYGVSKINLII